MPDHDLAAERFILGAIIESGGRVLDDLTGLRSVDYHRPQHQELHEALAEKFRKGEPIDMVSAAATCRAIRGLSDEYVVDLSQACTSWVVAPYHARRVTLLAGLRDAQGAGRSLVGVNPDEIDTQERLDGIVEDARKRLDAVTSRAAGQVTTFADVAEAAIGQIGDARATPTPWSGLNHMILGWRPTYMYVMGARPSTGKTVVSVQAAVHAAKQGLGVAYYTWEMSAERLYLRAVANVSGVDGEKLQNGNLSEAEWRAVGRADWELRELPIVVEGAAGWTAQQVTAHARAAHRRQPLGLIIIDHIGRIAVGERKHSREQEVADAANRFLDLAHHLDAATIVVTQLNRQPALRADPRPVATDIRETDVLEHNADVVMLLHRDREKSPDQMDVLIGKNRDGIDGPIHLEFDGSHSRVLDRPWRPSNVIEGGRR